MNKNGAIIIIEDDVDDKLILDEIFIELNYPNEIMFFSNGELALQYLTNSNHKPFLILSDINLPKLNGIELRNKIYNNEQLKLKCIPYLFFTTAADHVTVIEAYSQSIQGFFTKPSNYPDILDVIKTIIEYWNKCHSPNI